MLSRVADSLYWMSRYFERADNIARVIDATHSLMLSRVEVATDQRWYRAPHRDGAADRRRQSRIRRRRFAGSPPIVSHRSSMMSCLALARDNASQVREEISSEMWEQLNRLYHEVGAPERRRRRRRVGDAAGRPRSRQGSYAFHGVSETTMTHGEGWRFVQLGKYTERACAVSLLLDAYFGATTAADDLDWIALLASCAAFDSYCQGVHRRPAARSRRRAAARLPGVPLLGALLGRADVRVAQGDHGAVDRPPAGADRPASSAGCDRRWRSPPSASCAPATCTRS